ncbi:integration host factor subunit alpha [Striga asiatica]|uniref:Integration host factor subunit alpha n=1 Tax=Striga asiatica TaxID=4170 RepID=A0A5A7RE10_STRAF|nr:integration host factor subunit alpha [Striga asiatica]
MCTPQRRLLNGRACHRDYAAAAAPPHPITGVETKEFLTETSRPSPAVVEYRPPPPTTARRHNLNQAYFRRFHLHRPPLPSPTGRQIPFAGRPSYTFRPPRITRPAVRLCNQTSHVSSSVAVALQRCHRVSQTSISASCGGFW